MKLMTREMEGKLKSFPFYSQDGKGDDAIVMMKFFNPYGLGTWYVLEAEKQENGDYLFFGYVESPITPEFNEYGYFSLSELENLKIPIKINGITVSYGKIERDLYFEKVRIGDIIRN